MVSSQFDSAESDLIGGKIWIGGEHAENRALSRARKREIYRNLSSLLKVVETRLWAQTNRNMHVYLCLYNIAKLPDLYFSRKLQKTKLMCVAIFAIQ